MSDYKTILKKCEKYICNESYVYRTCNDTSSGADVVEWFVILQKTKETTTDEDRKYISDELCAKYRANQRMVIDIININNLDISKQRIVNKWIDYWTE